MVSTEPSVDISILAKVAQVITGEPQKLTGFTHGSQRIGTERIADTFAWDIPTLSASVALTVPIGSLAYVREEGQYIAEVLLGAIHVVHDGTTYRVQGSRALDKRMLRFSGSGARISGLAEAILTAKALLKAE